MQNYFRNFEKMNKKFTFITLVLFVFTFGISFAQVEITSTVAKSMYRNISMQHVSVHDPSVVYNPNDNLYYIFGSHRGMARSRDLQNWSHFSSPWGKVNANGTISTVSNSEAFITQQVKKIVIDGKEVDFPNFNAFAWSGAYGDYSVDGNMWAPDVIYNKVMNKWCMYLSINGPTWNSSIILLTSDKIDGTYVYQGPVVVTGFINNTNNNISYQKTDLQLAIGSTNSLPERYNRGNGWGNYWPHAIDPCVFYDEEGTLWMAYGSWSGGIWMLKLNPETGLRDYDVKYGSDYSSKGQGVITDPYFGKKIAGGYYVSGEGSYIEHIGNYYYLFVTYGELQADGGYEMRVFRSKNPDGPYTDTKGTSAIFTRYALNYGLNSDTRGEKLLGAYGEWGFTTVGNAGETAQGHNSVIDAIDGNTYLVYHTRFHNAGEGHQVRVHQLFLNEDNWLVAAPFEYNGEKFNNDSVSSLKCFEDNEILGSYQLMIHKYGIDRKNKEQVTPVHVVLNANGTISGDYSGRWSTVDNTSYITLTINGNTYKGVVVEQQLEPTTIKAVAITAVCSSTGLNVWAYKMRDDYSIAYTLNNSTIPVSNYKVINSNVNLYGFNLQENVNLTWSSSAPDIINEEGKYNPSILEADSLITLTGKLTCGNYYWSQTYTVRAKANTIPSGDFASGMVAYYGFDQQPLVNSCNSDQRAYLQVMTGGTRPVLTSDHERSGQFIHQFGGDNGKNSYVQLNNPFYQGSIDSGITLSFWLKRNTDDLVNNIFCFYNFNPVKRFFMTGNSYFGFVDNEGNWFDINNPDSRNLSSQLPVGSWNHVVVTISRSDGIKLYVNRSNKSTMVYSGEINGEKISTKAKCDFNLILDHIPACRNLYFGYGTKEGSADICIDDLMIYDRILSYEDVSALYQMENRVFDFNEMILSGIEFPSFLKKHQEAQGIFNLQGQKVEHPTKGIYIVNGKKQVYK